MAKTLSATVKMNDNITSGFARLHNAVNMTVGALVKMSNTDVSVGGIDDIYNELAIAGAELSRFKDNLASTTKSVGDNTTGQREWNAEIQNGNSAMDKMVNKLKTAFGVYALISGGKKIMGLSDEVAQIDAKLNLITDTEEQKQNLKNAVYLAAQSARVPMTDFANDVAKLGMLAGNNFSGNGEIVKYMGAVAKSFKLSGASATEVAGAMTQLNQAMASGVLQGDEFRSVRENAPMVAQAIAKYMGVSTAELKNLSSQGKITADIVKNAVLEMADEIDEKYQKIPKTWADLWTNAKSTMIKSLEPALVYVNQLANSPKVQGFINGMVQGFVMIGNIGAQVLGGLVKMTSFMYDNWKTLEPVIVAVASAVALYGAVQGLAAIKTGITTLALIGKKLALTLMMVAEYAAIVATEGLTVAQTTLNAAMYAFPGTWIVAVIVGIVAIIGTAIIATVKWATGTRTWAGAIVGAFYWVYGAVYNSLSSMAMQVGTVLAYIWNGFAAVANFIGNVMRDPASAFINFVKDMALRSLDILKGFAGAVDKVIGTNFAGTIDGWKGTVNSVATDLTSKFGNGQYKTVMEHKTAKDFGMDWGRKNLGGIYDKGKAVGDNRADKTKGLGQLPTDGLGGDLDLGGMAGENLGEMAKDGKGTKNNTGKIADKLDDTEEDLKYLRELAEKEHIDKFTTAEIKVEMNNTNNIEKDMDLDKMIKGLTDKLEEKLNTTANGVYK